MHGATESYGEEELPSHMVKRKGPQSDHLAMWDPDDNGSVLTISKD